MNPEEVNDLLVPITRESVIQRLKNLCRVEPRVCNDGDGHIDTWVENYSDGQYVAWTEIEDVIAWIETSGHG